MAGATTPHRGGTTMAAPMTDTVFPLIVLFCFALCAAALLLGVSGDWAVYGHTVRVLAGLGTFLPLVGASFWLGHAAMLRTDLVATHRTRLFGKDPAIKIDVVAHARQGRVNLLLATAALVASGAAVALAWTLHTWAVGTLALLPVCVPLAMAAWLVGVRQSTLQAWAMAFHPVPPAFHDRLEQAVAQAMARVVLEHTDPIGENAQIALEWGWDAQGYVPVRAAVTQGLPSILAPTQQVHPGTILARGVLWPEATDKDWRALGTLWPHIHAQSRGARLLSAHDRLRTLGTLQGLHTH